MSQSVQNTNVRPMGAGHRPLFIRQLADATADLDIQLSWQSDYWVACLERDALTKYVIGYTFPLNNAASGQIASDKVAASAVLGAVGLPVVPHQLLRFSTVEPAEWKSAALSSVALPLVVKPYRESAGIDVYRVDTKAELHDALTLLAQRYWAVAISPFVDIADEYRVIVLCGDTKLIYRKVRSNAGDRRVSEWRHNLHLGAYPELLQDKGLYERLSTLAVKAMEAMDLAFASVDIVVVGEQLQILEVNSSVTLERFGVHAPDYAEIALTIYKEALRCSFGL